MSEIYKIIDKKKIEVVKKPINKAHGLPNECYISKEYTLIERKKEQTVNMKKLQFIASLQLAESALQVCPDNVPEKIEKQFKIETERLKKLQGL